MDKELTKNLLNLMKQFNENLKLKNAFKNNRSFLNNFTKL